MKIDTLACLLLVFAALFAFGPSFVPPGPPPVPTPVDPDPTPVPPDPVVDTNPIPGPSPGLRVLIVREAQAQPTQADLTTMHAPEVLALLNRLCARGPDGRTPEWRVWDDDMSGETLKYVGEYWRRAYDRAKQDAQGQSPWLLIGNGTRGASQKLPASAAEFTKLIEAHQ